MKGQVWSLDFAVSVTIFLLILVPFLMIFGYIMNQNTERAALDDMGVSALSISDSLVRAAGVPQDWNATTVELVGLADTENVLDEGKVALFDSLGYDKLKSVMSKGYDFYMKISDLNGTVYTEKGSLPGRVTIVPVERYAVYRNRVVKLQLYLWSSTE
jgi:hypothetical protein